MKLTIHGNAREIAALVFALQERRETAAINVDELFTSQKDKDPAYPCLNLPHPTIKKEVHHEQFI